MLRSTMLRRSLQRCWFGSSSKPVKFYELRGNHPNRADQRKHFEALLNPTDAAMKEQIAAMPQEMRDRLKEFSEEHLRRLDLAEMKPALKPRRTGVLARKVGCMGIFDQWGERHPVTVVQIPSCHVLQILKQPNSKGLLGVQVGAGSIRPEKTTCQLLGHFAKAGVECKRRMKTFRVHPDMTVPVGTELTALHFRPGQLVDVGGITKGKGFAGVMKRWGFKGMPASHGVRKTHRHGGSIGSSTNPGRVWKKKKMPGRMGGDQKTIQNLKIMRIDPVNNLLFIRGSIQGAKGAWLTICDAIKIPLPAQVPVPTHLPSENDPTDIIDADVGQVDPFEQINNA